MCKRSVRSFYCLLLASLLIAGFPNAARAALDLSRVPGKVLTYIPSPDFWAWAGTPSAGVFTSDPEIAVLTNGAYLITHTTFHGDAVPGDVYMFRSTDKGETWTNLPLLHNLSSGGSFFYNNGILYLMGGSYIIQSTDNGTTWTTPVSTNSGVFTNLYSTWTPNNPTLLNNRIWSAANTRIQSASADSADLLAQPSWTWSANIAGNTNWFNGQFTEMTEAQVVASPEQGVVTMPKVRELPYAALIRANPNTGAATFDPDTDFVELPGGEKKFGAGYDPVSGKFFVLSNPVLPAHYGYSPWWTSVSSPAMIRNTTAVLTSRDLYNWKVEKIFLYSANIDHNAFQYCNFDFDGPDMAVVSRTAFDAGDVNPPPRGHDSNMVTFHKIEDFRNLSPDHYLTISGNQILRYERTPEPKDDDAPLGSFTLGSTFAGAALSSPNGIGTNAAGDVYIRETGGRILRFDAAGNFIETTNSSPVSFQTGAVSVPQPANGECSWSSSGSADWNEPLSWYYWGRPDTTNELAVFGSAATAATTVTVKSPGPEWTFSTNGNAEGWVTKGCTNATATNGVFSITVTNNDPQIYRTDLKFWGPRFPEVRVWMRAEVTNTAFELYWGTSVSNSFAGTRKVTATYTGQGQFQELVFPMAGLPEWEGHVITQLRLDPLTGISGKTVEIDSIKVVPAGFCVKGLRFRNPNSYTLSGPGLLRIIADSGLGIVDVQQGSHTSNVALVLGSDTDMNLTGGTALHLKQGMDLNGKALHVNGEGKLLIQGALVMDGGTLTVNGSNHPAFTNNLTGAALNGTLQFLPEGTFSPSIGTNYTLLDNASLLGSNRFAALSLPALPTGMVWNAETLYSDGKVSVMETVRYTLTVATPYGSSNPSGTNTYDYGTVLSVALTNSPVENGTTQYVCTGWTGTGSVPASGTSTNTGSFTLITNSTVTWRWSTNYWLSTSTSGNGSVDVSNDWKLKGDSVQITATPDAYWHFSTWSGTTNGCTINGNVITAPMTAPRAITAGFAIDRNVWSVDASTTWITAGSWGEGIIPGISGGSNSTDVALFVTTLTAPRTVTVDANRNIGGITFGNTSTNAYILTNGAIRLSNGGVIQTLDGTGNHNDTIASAITIMGNGGSATIRNDAAGNTAGLQITGGVAGSSTAGNTTTLYLDGVSTAAGIPAGSRNNSLYGTVSDGAGGGNLKLVKNGAGLWSIGLGHTFTGGFDFNAGTVRYNSNGSKGFGNGIITIGGNVTFTHANNTPLVITNNLFVNGNITLAGSANGAFSGAINLGAAIRKITQNAGTNTVFSGVISNGGLIKAGTDPLTLSGSNTYGEGTIVSNGALICTANGALGTSNVTVASGATLTLSATNCIGDPAQLTLAASATLNLNFAGTDTVAGISLDGGTTWLPFGAYNTVSLGALGAGAYTGSGILEVEGFANDPANTPYSWLAQYGLTNYEADATADADGDGLLTWQEYIAGTDPTNPASVFQITGGGASPQGAVIRWSSVSNRFYDLSRTTNLMEAFSILAGASNLPATPPENVYTNSQNSDAAFYKISVHE